MDKRQRIRSQLDHWANQFSVSPAVFETELDQSQAFCNIVAVDHLALVLERVDCRSRELADVGVEPLKQLAERLATELTYLLEPITPIEIDQQAVVIQMRSQPPSTDDGQGRAYYEVRADKRGVSLQRYRKPRRETRLVEPMTLTREVFVRLLSDFDSAIEQVTTQC